MTDLKNKIAKYHYEEIVLILLILSSDLSMYEEEDLVSFTEAIEGRIGILFEKEFLKSYEKKWDVMSPLIEDFEILRLKTEALFSPQWHIKLKAASDSNIDEIKGIATRVLKGLGVEYVEPKSYSETHLDVDW